MMKMLRLKILLFVGLFFIANQSMAKWTKVTAGAEFTVALGEDGSLWSWGFNGSGQLGLDSNEDFIATPQQIGTGSDWVDIDAGAFHCLALKANGTLWAWGLGASGQLGNGSPQEQGSPIQVGSDTDWVTISAGWAHSHAIKSNGLLYGWGSNGFGQVGDGFTSDLSSPTLIGGNSWASISGGGIHTLGIKQDGSLFSWGGNSSGQLGSGNLTDSNIPKQVGGFSNWQKIAAGFEFSVALNNSGQLFVWGINGNGQLGNGTGDNALAPDQISEGNSFIEIAAGSAFGFAISADRALFTWGANAFGELGIGSTSQQSNITQVGNDEDWHSIYCSDGGVDQNNFLVGFHSIGMKLDRDEFCVSGANYVGQLGNTTTSNQSAFNCNVGLGLVSIEELEDANTIVVFPNPVTTNLTIQLNEAKPELLIIRDLLGKKLSAHQLNNASIELDFAAFPRGIYFLNFIDENNRSFTYKLVKQ